MAAQPVTPHDWLVRQRFPTNLYGWRVTCSASRVMDFVSDAAI
jgi:hypothetical protein